MRGCGLNSLGLGQRQVAHPCKHGNKPSGAINCMAVSWLAQKLLAFQGVYHLELLKMGTVHHLRSMTSHF
jgi:hypothetical protein